MTQKYARLVGDVVAEVIELPDDAVVQRCFHTDIVKQLVAVPEAIRCEQGMIFLEGAGMFDDPPPTEAAPATKADLLAQSDTKMIRVVDELADIVVQLAAQVGGAKALSPEATAILADRRAIITSR